MELQTTVVDGVEYVLVPKTLISEEQQKQPQEEAHTIGLEGFLPEETIIDTSSETIAEEKGEEIKIVDSPELLHIPKAEGKKSGYRERFLSRSLLPHDVMTFPTVGQAIKNFTEEKEIRSADFGNRIPPGKWGFYGPGVESDIL